MKKILWIDVETTGLDPVKNDIVQLASLIEIDGEVKEDLNILLRPTSRNLSAQALTLQGRTEKEIFAFQPAVRGIEVFLKVLGKYVNQYDPNDKFIVGGYFVKFDLDFLRATFDKCLIQYFGSWFFSVSIDVGTYVAEDILGGLRINSYKLENVCNHYSIPLKAHDAMGDVVATRELYYVLKGKGK